MAPDASWSSVAGSGILPDDKVALRLLDPEGRYPAAILREVDERALRICIAYPWAEFERTRDVFQMRSETGLGVVVTLEAIEFRIERIEWQGPHAGARSSTRWRRLRWKSEWTEDSFSLRAVIAEANRAHQERLRKCTRCGDLLIPGTAIWLGRKEGWACDGCSGFVF